MRYSHFLGLLRGGPVGRVLGWVAAGCLVSCADSDADRKRIHTGLNRAPTAAFKVTGVRRIGAELVLDARDSSDPDGDPLEAVWSIDQKPGPSGLTAASFIAARPMTATIVPDQSGMYKLRLTTSDGELQGTAAAQILIEPSPAGQDDDGGDSTVSLICPSLGSLLGGDLVRITGGVFPEGTRVLFGDRPGTELQILEDGSVIEVRTPPADAAGPVDVTVELGERAVVIRGAFRYLAGPLAFSVEAARDVSLDRSPASLASLDQGRVLLGLASGAVRLATFAAGAAELGPTLTTGGTGRIVRLHPGAAGADGATEVGGVTAGGGSAFVIRVAADGEISATLLDFAGEATDAVVADPGAAGGPRVFVADRAGKRIVAYAAAAASGGQGFAPVTEYAVAGTPCVIVAAQVDADPELELVVGCYPGPALSVLDEADGAVTSTPHELPEAAGIVLLAPGDFTREGRDALAAVVLDGGTGDPEHGPRSVRIILPAASGEAFTVRPRPRVELRSGGNGLEPADLDRDGDLDLVAFSGASGEALVLENTLADGPEVPEECASILETGDLQAAATFDVRLLRVPMFGAPGILAIVAADLEGDGFPDLLGSHLKELAGLRGVPNATGQ